MKTRLLTTARALTGATPARPISAFTDEGLTEFTWSPDGRYLYFISETVSRDVVLITNFRSGGKTP